MEVSKKACTRCKEFKSLELFYRQGDRIESVCKDCKKEARKKKKFEEEKIDSPQTETKIIDEAPAATPHTGKPRSYEDLGLTKNEFLEVVEFFKELMRLDQKGK